MEIPERERHALHPYTHAYPPYPGEVGRGTYPALAKSRALGQSCSRVGQFGAISPPPLKRQRTEYEDSSLGELPAAYNDWGGRVPAASSNVLWHSFDGQTAFSKPDPSGHAPAPLPIARSFSGPASHREHVDPNTHLASTASRTHSSRPPSRPPLPHRSACRICDKTTATSYNPIIACPGCSRLYHDSCRKPALSPGSKHKRWRCSSCLAHDRTYKSPEPSSAATFKNSVVKDIFKPRSGHIFPAAISPQDYHHVAPNSRPEAPGLHNSGIHLMKGLNRPRETHRFSQQHEPRLAEMPTHSSGLLALRATSSRSHYDVEAPVRATLDARSQSQELTPSIAPYSICHKMHVPTESTIEGTEFQGCRDRSYIMKQEAPETLGSTPLYDNLTGISIVGVKNPAVSTNEPVTAVNRGTLKSSPRQVGDLETSSMKTASHIPVLGGTYTSAARITHTVGMITVPEPEQAKQTGTPPDSTSLQPVYIETQNEETPVTEPDIPTLRVDACAESLSPTSDSISTNEKHTLNQKSPTNVIEEIEHEDTRKLELHVSHKSTLSPSDAWPSIEQDPENEDTPKSELHVSHKNSLSSTNVPPCSRQDPESEDTRESDLHVSHKTTPSLTTFPPCTSPDPESTALSVPEKRHTNRELAIIALLAANGSAMTALQVIDWLAQRFSYLRKGQGAWEKSLRAVLSNSSEFSSAKDVLAHKRCKLYNFGNAACRARFETEYRQYVTNDSPESSLGAQSQRGARPAAVAMPKVSHRKAIKSAPSRGAFVLTPKNPYPGSVVSPRTTSLSEDEENGPLPNSFDRSVALRSDTYNKLPESGRETSFFRMRTRCIEPSIETMTVEEKATKIAEIQARPSRKKFFVSAHRLGHVLKQRRQDIHDESDGAWKPNSTSEKEKRWLREERSLQEIFNLPENPVPMNDGQELAFRDGALLNGRLPRPRQIYRVGKLFVGELTTRQS